MTKAKEFWNKVDICGEDDCWNWTAGKIPAGYGAFAIGRKNIGTHRLAYEYSVGKIPDGMFVCHRCDNKSCCNPNHLFLGTNSDNMNDMYKKGYGPNNKGENNGKHKLTSDEVKNIVFLKRTQHLFDKVIANKFNISESIVSRIISGAIWSSVTGIQHQPKRRNSGI